jgi:hypothetical protein
MRKDNKSSLKYCYYNYVPVQHTPASESERRGVIKALDKDVADMKSRKIKSHKYSISEFEKKNSNNF